MAVKDKKLKASDYVHLHNHTQYSLLDGLTKIPAMIDQVEALGMEAVAMTDHGTLSGAIEFYKAARDKNIKPLIGMEAYVAPRKHTDKDVAHDKQYYHLIILAMNNHGYQNLMRLSTIANLDGFYYKPRIDRQLLEKYNEGLIVLSGCISSEVGDALRQGQHKQALETATWYKKVFGDRYYFEIQDHGHPDHPSHWAEQTAVNEQVFKLAAELDVPPVITGDAHYLMKDDQEAHEILLCVQTGSFLSDEKRMSLKEFELYVADPRDVIKRWGGDYPEAIRNTKAIADRCEVVISLDEILIPKFPVPKGETEETYLRKLVQTGLEAKYGKKLTKEVTERADYELGVIGSMGFNGYFLIVADFVNWGKDQGIVFGPGRGSTAGSIVAYALHITELDPLKYDLLFERFLNPDRISMPDADIDIQDTRRDEVIQYCVTKYGADRVANIVTFGRMAARNAVRDVARVLQVPYAESDRLAKMIPPPVQGRHILLATSIKENAELKQEYQTNPTAKEVFDLAVKLEGTIRSHGVHAAGVVIAPDDIVKFVPLEMAQKGVVATQYSMGPIEELGLLKMDFLGLSNLTVIQNALRIIKKVYGQDVDVAQVPLDDTKTFKLFQKGDTTGVFQFESAGMKRYLKSLKPTMFDDLIAMNALYRPGPMQWIGDFVARKHGKKKIEYLHEKTEAALKNTYGILVYQEQVMQIAKDLCGFTGGQADTLRKGVAKKKPEVLAALKKEFIGGALKNSDITQKKIDEFWTSLEAFAAYCFPKAHAACYATIAYWTAYLKANYPAAFMAALMTSDYDDTDRLSIEISECKNMGVEVLPPDVQESFGEFAVISADSKKPQIRFGMNAVKNVGSGAVDEILRAREADGPFKNLEDFLSKVSVRIANRKALESLIKAGALDSFGDRSVLLNNLDALLAYANRLQKDKASGQTDIFGDLATDHELTPKLALNTANVEEYGPRQYLFWERELLGIYLSNHPLADFENILAKECTAIRDLGSGQNNKPVKIGGSISDSREITTKNGQKMAFVKVADLTGEIELILFPGTYQKTEGLWQRDNIVVISGKLSTKDKSGQDGELKILVDDAREITHEQALNAPAAKVAEKRVYIRVPDTSDRAKLTSLKTLIDQRVGITPVVLVVGQEDTKKIIKLPTSVEPDESLLSSLAEVFGEASVKYQ